MAATRWPSGAEGTNLPHQIVAVHAGQADVADQNVAIARGQRPPGRRRRRRRDDRGAMALEQTLQELARVGLVLDDQHAHPVQGHGSERVGGRDGSGPCRNAARAPRSPAA